MCKCNLHETVHSVTNMLCCCMQATKDVLALSSLEVDLSKVELGQTVTVKWRGKPVFIRHRTEHDIDAANAVDPASLRDPEPDDARVQKPEVGKICWCELTGFDADGNTLLQWLVLVGVCTHLGCVPLPNAGDYNGWFCPCHGSHYDTSGRVRKGPAPYNLEVPTYSFIDENTLMVG